MTTIKRVLKSDYLESIQHNRKLYNILVENIEESCKKYLSLYPEMTITISMSARYQTPTIIITNNEDIPRQIGAIQEEIESSLDSVGFTFMDTENNETNYGINFED